MPPLRKVKVLYKFQSQYDSELNANPGDVLVVVKPDDGGWTTCRRLDNSASGLVPTGYLTEYTPPGGGISSKARQFESLNNNNNNNNKNKNNNNNNNNSSTPRKVKLQIPRQNEQSKSDEESPSSGSDTPSSKKLDIPKRSSGDVRNKAKFLETSGAVGMYGSVSSVESARKRSSTGETRHGDDSSSSSSSSKKRNKSPKPAASKEEKKMNRRTLKNFAKSLRITGGNEDSPDSTDSHNASFKSDSSGGSSPSSNARPLPTPPRSGSHRTLEEVIRDGPRTPRSPRPLNVEREEKKEDSKPVQQTGESSPSPKQQEKPKMPKDKAKKIIYESLCELQKWKKFRHFIRKSPDLKNGRLRNQYIQEIITTERTYVSTLEAVVEVFVKQLKGKKKILDPEKQDVIFSNIEQLHKVNKELLGDLEAANNEWPVQCNIGQVFCRMAPFLKTYTTYINNYDEADSMLEKQMSKSSKFASWVDKQQQNPKVNNITLQGLLITPIQRIPRYKLLLNDLLKRTPENHRDYPSLTKALESIKEIAQFVNESKRKNENTQIMMDLQEQLKNKLPHLIQPSRKFIKEVKHVSVTCGPLKLSSTTMNAYLFSDLLLLLPAHSSGDNSPIVIHHVLAKLLSDDTAEEDGIMRIESLQPSGRTVFEFRDDNLRAELGEDLAEYLEQCKHIQDKRNTDLSLRRAEGIRMKLGHKVPRLKKELSTLHIESKTMKRRLVEINKDLESKIKQKKQLERQINMDRQELSKTKVELKDLMKKETNLSSEVAEEEDDVKEADEVLWTALNEDQDAFQYLFESMPMIPIDKESQPEKHPTKTGDGPTIGRGFRLNNLIKVNVNDGEEKEEKEVDDLLEDEEATDRHAQAILDTDDSLLTWEDFINDDSPEMVRLNRLHHVNLHFPIEQDIMVHKYKEDREVHGYEPQVKSNIQPLQEPEVQYKYQEPLSAKMCEETVAGEEGESTSSSDSGAAGSGGSNNGNTDDVKSLKKQLEKLQDERDMWKKKYSELRMKM